MVKQSAIFLLSVLFLVACNPAAKLVKQGDVKRQAELYDDASTLYYNALLHKPDNENAKEGLAISAQKVLNEKFSNFNKLVVENNIDEAMKAYKNAENYSQTSASVGVPLRWPTEYDEVYFDIRAEYISKLYDEALVQMKNKHYEQAEQTFEQIAALDTTYRGITVLRLNTVLEPLYQHALIELQQGKYKQAYQSFSKIVLQDETYKNAKALKEEANQRATTTVGVLPVYITGNQALNTNPSLSKIISERLMQKSFAYVKVQPYETVQQTLESRGWTSISDLGKAVEAGKMLGLKYVLWVEVKNIIYKETPLTSEQKTAFEAFSENILNPYTGTYSAITKFKKVTYNDIYEQRMINLVVSYKLIATVDGKVVLGDEREHTQKDEAHQLVYPGNINTLYEELPTSNYLPPANQAWRDLFTNVKRLPLTQEQLTNEAVHQLAKQISQSVIAFYK